MIGTELMAFSFEVLLVPEKLQGYQIQSVNNVQGQIISLPH